MDEIQLTEEQSLAVSNANSSIKEERPLYRIGGYAGTGKTTIMKFILKENPRSMPCAFTGKAALRLRQKGVFNARTIHSTIYEYNPEEEIFELRDEVEGDWFPVDEASMVSKQLWEDLQSFNLPILCVGDPGQLEPVGDDPDLMKDADFVLSKILRQAEDNNIIKFATDVRMNRFQPYCSNYSGEDVVIYTKQRKPLMEDLQWADIIICGFNRTRTNINYKIRIVKGRKGLLVPEERIVILQNNRSAGVFNGQLLTVKSIKDQRKETTIANCIADDGEELTLLLLNAQFGQQKTLSYQELKDQTRRFDWKTRRKVVLADYGYVITCHKSQGSEWDKVLVIDEQCDYWDVNRWRYTAITRASKQLRYFL